MAKIIKMEWTEEMILEFIENYETEPVIWNPRHPNNKKKQFVANAWQRLKDNLSFHESVTIEDLKKKRDSLMAYYRIHLNKMKNTMDSDESYKTTWYAFAPLHNFLAPIYECSASPLYIEVPIETDTDSRSTRTSLGEDSSFNKQKRKQDMPDVSDAKKQMTEAFSMIKEIATLNKPEKMHECDLYAQLLAERLKKMDEDRRFNLMHAIDNLVYQERTSIKSQEQTSSEVVVKDELSVSSPPQSTT